jgi:rfaE bifunctional protein nucleotidyltransferase chain/domain
MKNLKFKTIAELSDIVAKLKSDKKTIVHCHGCFDLMHLGHIKHFESAKKMADVLIVTLTQDKFVNKGPGRPVFNEHQRAEAIAALECVDYVAINAWATAEETIRIIKPDFYVKGPDYKIQTNDITNNIGKEENAVKEAGGVLKITEDDTFSSSNLINSHFSQLSDHLQEYLASFKRKYTVEEILKYIEELQDLKVLVIGDTIVDEYHTCTPLGKSSKSPTISTIYRHGVSYAGGILAIANHINEYAGKVHLMSVIGDTNSHEELIKEKLNPSITSNFLVFEVTYMEDSYISQDLEQEFIAHFNQVKDEYDLIVLADFGHGFITPSIIEVLENSNKFLCINAQTNSNNFGYNYITKYHRADYISIDEKELRLPFGDAYGNVENLIQKLKEITNTNNIQITLGAAGSVIFNNETYTYFPAFASSVKDSVGAGDAVLSITSLCSYNNVPAEITGFIGNCTGSLAVNILGNEHPVYKKDLVKFISHFIK